MLAQQRRGNEHRFFKDVKKSLVVATGIELLTPQDIRILDRV